MGGPEGAALVREKERQIFALQTELLRSSRAAESAAAEVTAAKAEVALKAEALDDAV